MQKILYNQINLNKQKGLGDFMTVYIEYAFLENFLLDFLLLRLALRGGKEQTTVKKLCLSACIGGVYAVVYPLSNLPKFWDVLSKIAVGALMCAVAFGKLTTINECGRYAFTVVFFFILSFSFAGALTFLGANGFYSLIGFGFLCLFAEYFIKKLYRKRREKALVYHCAIAYDKRVVRILGFYDSGNLATHNALPVCFLSPEVFYELWGEAIFEKGRGQVCDEITIHTLSGEKKLPVCLGELQVENGAKKEVYFSPSVNMLKREYKLLLHSRIFDNEEGETR